MLEAAVNSSDNIVVNTDFLIHIIVTWIPKNIPIPEGKHKIQNWAKHIGSKHAMSVWKTLGVMQNTSFGYKMRFGHKQYFLIAIANYAL